MRALRWVVTCTVLLAAGTAYGAEPVKIRASWIVAPSDWTPLLLEKPELMKSNGKTYAFEPQRFQGTPAVITARLPCQASCCQRAGPATAATSSSDVPEPPLRMKPTPAVAAAFATPRSASL